MITKFEDKVKNPKKHIFLFDDLELDKIYICEEYGFIGKKIITSEGYLFLLLNREKDDYEAFRPISNAYKFTEYCDKLTYVVE